MDDFPLSIALLSGALSALGTWMILPILKRHVLDIPNARSNHSTPVPRGGGITMIAAALIGLGLTGLAPRVIAAALLLAAVSFMDDFRGLPVRVRLVAQLAAVCLCMGSLPGRILPEAIPYPIEYILLVLSCVWFINLTNFMDGIDGISAMQAIMMAAGICLVHFLHPWIPPALAAQAAVMAASAYGFYLFNRHPAKLFMGDVGSVPLGFLMGYLLLRLAAYGYLAAALILPAYYVSDATLTLVKRLRRGEKVWQAHSDHAYQRAARSGLSHAQVVERIAWLNAALVALALAGTVSMMAGVLSLIAAYGLTYLLIRHFTHAPLP